LAEAEAFLEQQSDPYLAAALAAARSRTEAAAIDCHPWRDALPGSGPVTPVAIIDELIETVLRVVDRSFRFTSTIERSLDGLAALHNEKPKDFGLRVGPLVARVNKVFSTDQPTWGDHFSTDFCFLVAQWIEPHRQVAHPENVDSPRTWLMARLREVALMIQTGVRARLLALPTDDSDWVDPAVLAERAVSVGDEALNRPHDVAIAIARLAPWGRAEALKRLHDVPGTLAAVIRVACGGDDPIDEAPDVVRRMVAWHLTRPADGAPYLFGDVAPPTPTKAEFPLNAYAQATITQLPDGGIFMDPSGVPEWQAYEQWIDHQRHTSYGAAWGMSQWPGDADWVWTDQLLSRHNVRSLLDPDASLPPVALGRVIELICDDTAEMRTLATDVMIQAISDGRLTSPQLTAALATPTDSVASGRLATALVAVAAASPLHRAVVARGLIATAPAWSGMQARPLCTILELLDEIFTADRVGTASIVAREAIGPLAKGRSKTATLATRVLAHEPTERWPADASAVALTARVIRAKRRTGGPRTA